MNLCFQSHNILMDEYNDTNCKFIVIYLNSYSNILPDTRVIAPDLVIF